MSSVTVVGTDATMVADALRLELADALSGVDPDLALTDLSGDGEGAGARALEALRTPAFLAPRRVVVVRDAQLLAGDEADDLVAWMAVPTPDATLVLGVVGAKSHRLAKGASRLVETSVGSGARARQAHVDETLARHGVAADAAAAALVAERVGDDVARVDSIARSLRAVYGEARVGAADVEPYLGEAGSVPAWDLTDALDRGDAAGAITAARRMLDSRERVGLQVVAILQRHYLAMARLEGRPVASREEAAVVLKMSAFPAEKVWRSAQRLGPERVAAAVRFIADADRDLKGGVSYGGRDDGDVDPTESTVIEVLAARLARLSAAARR